MSTMKFFEYSLRKRVGNDKQIEIWADRWFLNNEGGKVITMKPGNCELRWVSELNRSNQRDVGLIRSIFNPHDAISIISTTIRVTNGKHRWVWYKSATGIYTVKSGYI
ncbi:hypothetical protein ACH5RR_012260 [Cinchona calisaya]|uniref:Uncharacterized protein n=1 Tax=Cinchona calisaya TaxID=153742 RepID=A0ABD3A7B4_9GENT